MIMMPLRSGLHLALVLVLVLVSLARSSSAAEAQQKTELVGEAVAELSHGQSDARPRIVLHANSRSSHSQSDQDLSVDRPLDPVRPAPNAIQLHVIKRQDGGNLSTSLSPESPSIPETTDESSQPTPLPIDPSGQSSNGNSHSSLLSRPTVTLVPSSFISSATPAPTDATSIGPITNVGNTASSPAPDQTTLPAPTSIDITDPQGAPTSPFPTTAIDTQGSVIITIITPSAGLVTTTIVRTRTNALGEPETVTSVEVIEASNANPSPTVAEESSSAAQTAEPSLQTGSAIDVFNRRHAIGFATILAGAVSFIICLI